MPLNAEAVALISKQVGKHLTHVFSFAGSRFDSQYQGLVPGAGMRRRPGIPLARSTVHLGELARAETAPLYALQEMGGWEGPEMVRRYAHLSAEHPVPKADRLCALRAADDPDGTFLLHPGNDKEPAMSQPL